MEKSRGSKLSQNVDRLIASREKMEKEILIVYGDVRKLVEEIATIQHEIDALKKNINIINEKFVKLP